MRTFAFVGFVVSVALLAFAVGARWQETRSKEARDDWLARNKATPSLVLKAEEWVDGGNGLLKPICPQCKTPLPDEIRCECPNGHEFCVGKVDGKLRTIRVVNLLLDQGEWVPR